MRRLLIGIVVLAFWRCPVLRAEVTLVESGEAVAVIALAPEAAWIDRHAAQELSQFVARITGTPLPIAAIPSAEVTRATVRILIGRAETNSLIRELVAVGRIDLSELEPGGDGFAIKTVSHDDRDYLILSGGRGRSDLYAVYDFLEQECGVGFFWDGDRVPKRETLAVESIDRDERPYFSWRMAPNACSYVYSSQYWDAQDWKRAHDYMAKRKLNVSYFTLGREVVMHRVWKRFGMNTAEPSQWARWEADLQREVRDYAEKLEMETVGQLWGGHVTPEFAAAYPQRRYVVAEWAGVSTSYNIHPADPMFQQVVKATIEEWQKAYGPTHIWDQAPYPETSPGATAEDKRQLKIDWARNMTTAIAAADPQGLLYMSGWFLQGGDWTEEVCREFFDAMGDHRFLVSDAWAETRPVFTKTGYFGGRAEWMFGVLNTFGNVERLHGDLQDLIRRVQGVVADSRARYCTGFYIDPESTHHNFLYFDLASVLAWDPRPVELDAFLHRYCDRRYGTASASAMVDVWKLVARTAYADNLEANPRPFYHNPLPRDGGGTDLFADADRILARLRQTPTLQRALQLALAERDSLQRNPHYQRDLLDIARTLLGILFDYRAACAHSAFADAKDTQRLTREGQAALRILGAIERLVSTRREFFLETEMEYGRRRPVRRQPVQSEPSQVSAQGAPTHPNDREVRLRFTALAGMDKYPGLLDYAAADRVELIRHYYRPRVEAWLEQMRDRIETGTIDYGSLLQGPYRQVARAFVAGDYPQARAIPSQERPSDVVSSLLEVIEIPAAAMAAPGR